MPSRTTTAIDYRERLNRVIFHIEANLGESLCVAELARVAHLSPHHFHRIFSAFEGEPLVGFVRRLRLERAAQDLVRRDAPITEIGIKAGYETGSAFTRAFVANFGITPTRYRQRNTEVGLAGTKTLVITPTTEDMTMTPEIRRADPIEVLFVRRTGPYYEAADGAFAALCGFAGPRGLLGPGVRMIGISHDDPRITEESKFRYDACVTVDREISLEGDVGRKTISGGRYAVFLHEGPYEKLHLSYDRVFRAWLPQSGERLRDEPCFEVYMNHPGGVSPEELRTEVWIPLEPADTQ